LKERLKFHFNPRIQPYFNLVLRFLISSPPDNRGSNMQSEFLPQMLKSTPSSGEGIQILPQELKPLQKGYKYELYPNKQQQQEYLEKIFGSCRWVYNNLLYIQKNRESI
jgi:hypothetical protein